ncbi:MAG: AMP phosphorylase [Candidatus Lokiarchaeota archaeon]|nr:AMP phosphorylase [Candidatus Lokiarchaeota archaeon]
MNFKIKRLGLTTGQLSVVILDDDDAFALGAKPGDRVRLFHIKKDGEHVGEGIVASVDVVIGSGFVERGEVGLYEEVAERLKLESGEKEVEIQLYSKPRSFDYIKKKIQGHELNTLEIQEVITDCTKGTLLPIEMAAFIVALEINGTTDDEVVKLTDAMTNSGEVFSFPGETVYDKHSTGGVPGNKVTEIIVPICKAAGLFIPKTSTRAITSPSGTADVFEVLAPVAFSKKRLLEILKKERAGIFWGGAIDSAPADNALINIEKPLNLDPFGLMIASIICKKKSLGVTKLVLDIPCGKGTKFPTVEDGKKYAFRFKEIAKRVGIEAVCLLTSASQPIGHAVGPALEAREALQLLIDPSGGPSSLLNKSCELAGVLLEMAGKAPEGKGKDLAIEYVRSGEAYEAMRAIIKAQGGNPDIQPADIEVGPHVADMRAVAEGHITNVDNSAINRIAKIAGCPAAKKSGTYIHQKIGAQVKKGEVVFTIYSDSKKRLEEAVEYYNQHLPQKIGGMTLDRI